MQAIDGDKTVVTEQTVEPPIADESNTITKETTDTSITTTAQESTVESTQESTIDTAPTVEEPITERSQQMAQDELTAVQQLSTKEDTVTDVQEELKESVVGLSASNNLTEHITELPTLQEKTVPQELQEFTEITTSKRHSLIKVVITFLLYDVTLQQQQHFSTIYAQLHRGGAATISCNVINC